MCLPGMLDFQYSDINIKQILGTMTQIILTAGRGQEDSLSIGELDTDAEILG